MFALTFPMLFINIIIGYYVFFQLGIKNLNFSGSRYFDVFFSGATIVFLLTMLNIVFTTKYGTKSKLLRFIIVGPLRRPLFLLASLFYIIPFAVSIVYYFQTGSWDIFIDNFPHISVMPLLFLFYQITQPLKS